MTTTDLVVVLPGIMGSTLHRDGTPVWAPSPGAVFRALGSAGGSIRDLTLPVGIGDDDPEDGVLPADLMPDVHALPGIWTPVKGYTPLVEHLRGLGYYEDQGEQPGNLLLVPYDWRLSNRFNGRRLKTLVEPALARWRARGGRYQDAQVVFVCHSMGGLVARWYIEREGGAEVTRKLITLGTPYRGAAKALVQLLNGIPAKIGPLSDNLTTLARSLPSIHQLLPEYACITRGADLVRTTDLDLPDLSAAMVSDAMAFHTQLRDAEDARAREVATMTHAIVGSKQPTITTVTLSPTGPAAVALDTYGPDNLYGDATVPLTGAVRAGLPLDSPVLRRVADRHGNLQRNQAALDEIEGILTGQDVVVRAQRPVEVRVTMPDYTITGEPIEVTVDLPENHAILITVTNHKGVEVDRRAPRVLKAHATSLLDPQPPGTYSITIAGTTVASPVAPVTGDHLVWDPAIDE